MRRALIIAASVAFAAVVWSQVIHSGTVNYDTPWLVVHNPLLSPGDPSVIPTILWDMSLGGRNTLGAEYLPVRDLTVLLDFALFGDRFALHHLTNLLYYLIACGLFYALCVHILGPGMRALGASLLFLVHPAHVESVAWLASRKDVVSLALFFAALYLGLSRRDKAWPWVSAGVALMAIWAKNTAIVLPGLLVAASLILRADRPKGVGGWARWALGFVPWGVVTVAALAISTRLGGVVGIYAAPRFDGPLELLFLQGRINGHYLVSMLWPPSLTIHYEGFGPLGATPLNVAAAAVYLAMLLAIPLWARSRPVTSFGLAWWFLTLLPVSQLIPLQNLVADRYLLIPSAGLILAAAGLIPLKDRAVGAALVVAALVLSPFTFARSKVWQSSEALWQEAWSRSPGDPELAMKWSGAVEDRDRALAESILADALERHPDHGGLNGSMGLIAMAEGDADGAEAYLRRAVELEPDGRKPLNNLAVLLYRRGKFDEAALVALHLAQTHPRYAIGWNTLGLALMDSGDLPRARAAFLEALEVDPFYASAVCNLGTVHLRGEDRDGALRWWRRCLEVDPGNSQAVEALKILGE